MKRLYQNGTILTMENGELAEAVLVEDGRIRYVGTQRSAPRVAPTETVDLNGKALLPAFIDAHSHFSAAANALLQVPLEECVTMEEIAERVGAFIKERRISPGEWVTARGYDHNQLAGGLHPDRDMLDRVAPTNPLVLQHRSGHVGVFNTRALQRLGVTDETVPPPGGLIQKKDGRLTGYMEETAFLQYLKQVPTPEPAALLDAYRLAQHKYASHGITTVQEGMMVDLMEPMLRAMLDAGLLRLDLVGYVDAAGGERLLNAFRAHLRTYVGHFKIGGYKMFLDGSPQGRTAWMRTPYVGGGCGYPTLTDDEARRYLQRALKDGMQLLAHCNGDAAAAQYLRLCREAAGQGADLAAIRPVMIHAQLLGPDQLDEVRALSVIPSFFVAHVYHWGDTHIKNFGADRAKLISPAGSALHQNICFTFHQDTPVLEPDMLETIWCAATRRTKAGVLLGENERIPVYEALRAVTANAAYQYFEENEKGSIAVGKRADLVVLDQDPLAVPPEDLRGVRVVETIKDGETIYAADS